MSEKPELAPPAGHIILRGVAREMRRAHDNGSPHFSTAEIEYMERLAAYAPAPAPSAEATAEEVAAAINPRAFVEPVGRPLLQERYSALTTAKRLLSRFRILRREG